MTEVRKVGAHRKLDTAAKRRMAFVAMAATGVAAAGATGAGAATVQSDDKGSDIALTSNTEVLAQGAGGSAPGGDIADSAAQILDLPQVTQISELGNQLSSALEFDAARAAEDLLNRTPSTVKPAEGSFTSGYAMRWGTMHKGIDIANGIGTPIAAAQSGTVIDAGPASGFGNWVRIKHSDGTVTVYGHMSTIDVTVGQQVQA
ncbi:MAG: M23 family metallopeptidase, partial [Corynebacterium sp.]